jgi:hypothetical protein
MGREITDSAFSAADREHFARRLAAETRLARDCFRADGFAGDARTAGFELEAWLVDRNFFPASCNQSFLARLASPLVVAELSRFNIELNGTPQPLRDRALSALEAELAATWERSVATAHEDEATVVAIGTLPTLREADLSLANMTPSNRYAALNREVMRLQGSRPLSLDIRSPHGHLVTTHADVMLEAATTSWARHPRRRCHSRRHATTSIAPRATGWMRGSPGCEDARPAPLNCWSTCCLWRAKGCSARASSPPTSIGTWTCWARACAPGATARPGRSPIIGVTTTSFA